MTRSNTFGIRSRISTGTWYRLWIPILLAIFLVISSFQNYLIFHTLAELFAIIVAVLASVVIWNTYHYSRNNYLLYLGCGYPWVVILDLAHTLTYKGMSIFSIEDANPATQLWISSRYLEAILLFSAPTFLSRPFNKYITTVFFGVVSITVYTLVMTGNFPDAFIEGSGLTTFKVISEYVIIGLLIGSLIYLWRQDYLLDRNILILLTYSIIFTIFAELSFTFYVSVYGFSNLVGHIFKLFSFWFIFEAIIFTAFKHPDRLMSNELREELAEIELQSEKRKKNETTLIAITENSPDYIMILDDNYKIKFINHTLPDLRKEEVIGQSILNYTPPEYHDTSTHCIDKVLQTGEPGNYETMYESADGVKQYFYVRISPLPDEDGRISRLVSTSTDITKRKQLEENLEYESTHDALTGLYNRREFEQRIEHEIKRAARYGHDLSLFMLDLDHFKNVNDTHGHKAGDIVLKEIATVLANLIRETDFVARYGGEEFVVALPETGFEKAFELAERIRQQIAIHGFKVKAGVELNITTSVGIASFPEHAKSWGSLYEAADKAMYSAKNSGRNCCMVTPDFNPLKGR